MIAAIPIETAIVAMLVIRAEAVFLCCLWPCILRENNNSIFNEKKLNYLLIKNTFLFWVFLFSYSSSISQEIVLPGINQLETIINNLQGKKIGVVANQSSILRESNKNQHLVDYLIQNKIDIEKVFAPEHGFRGKADAGEKIKTKKDKNTGLEIISLYGKNRKPSVEKLNGIELMIFDLQDVGVRFYTYLSTLHYVMEACAENNIPLIVLDRPNPNIQYVDGPILESTYKSFVGMHPVPIVYGMTIGEYAQMINGEGWLNNKIKVELKIIPIKNYTRDTFYELPIRPSPNLPNSMAIALYPSLCLMEATVYSIGRGTELQFQIYGHPEYKYRNFSFKPRPNFGSKYPKHNNVLCYGKDLSNVPSPKKIELKWIIDAYRNFPYPNSFFLNGFNRIAGNSKLKQQLINGTSEIEIRKSWIKDLNEFKKVREKYLIYVKEY